MSVGMCKKLFKLLRSCLIGYLSPGERPDWFDFLLTDLNLTPSEYTKYEEYHDLLHKQNCIEWDNLLRAKFSKRWKTFQRRYERRQTYIRASQDNPYDKPKKKKQKKDRFQTFFADVMTAAKEELWKERNQHQHKPDDKRQSAAEAKTDMTISNMYQEYNKVLPNDLISQSMSN